MVVGGREQTKLPTHNFEGEGKAMNWDEYFVQLANCIALKSKDRSVRVGCVIIGPNKEVRSTGYNGLPRWANDSIDERFERPLKVFWSEHAERNAIYNAALCGVSTKDCTMYLSQGPNPCADCARAIVQAGIECLVGLDKDFPTSANWKESIEQAAIILHECGVRVKRIAV